MQKLVEKLEEMYDRDALTGMYNRRWFENRGNPMFEQAKEEGKQIFLAIIDMDGMKQINDNYGHIEGDYALKKVREAIHHACPDAVIQARTGGDEFEIIAEDIAEGRAQLFHISTARLKYGYQRHDQPYHPRYRWR